LFELRRVKQIEFIEYVWKKKRNTGSRGPDFDGFRWSFALETGPSKVGRVLTSKVGILICELPLELI